MVKIVSLSVLVFSPLSVRYIQLISPQVDPKPSFFQIQLFNIPGPLYLHQSLYVYLGENLENQQVVHRNEYPRVVTRIYSAFSVRQEKHRIVPPKSAAALSSCNPNEDQILVQ